MRNCWRIIIPAPLQGFHRTSLMTVRTRNPGFCSPGAGCAEPGIGRPGGTWELSDWLPSPPVTHTGLLLRTYLVLVSFRFPQTKAGTPENSRLAGHLTPEYMTRSLGLQSLGSQVQTFAMENLGENSAFPTSERPQLLGFPQRPAAGPACTIKCQSPKTVGF